MKKAYFAGGNTVRGFVSYYENIFDGIERLYVIKGGPGTGKSRFMKEVADAAERKGRDVEYFYCSFDPSSLDGIIIDGTLALVDGTAPHVYEPTFVGVKENLVDLGSFWDEELLRERGEEIKELAANKKMCFVSAYSYLSVIGALDGIVGNIVNKCIDRDMIRSNAARLLSEIKPPQSGKKGVRIVSALGMKGAMKFDTFEKYASKIVMVKQNFGEGYHYIRAIKNEAERLRIPTAVSYSPLFCDRPDALLLGGSVAVVLSNEDGDERFSRFESRLSEGEKNELSELEKQMKINEAKAVKYLKKASKKHFGLESIFVSSMDFEKKEAFCKEFIKRHI
jgi:hypothetical protein